MIWIISDRALSEILNDFCQRTLEINKHSIIQLTWAYVASTSALCLKVWLIGLSKYWVLSSVKKFWYWESIEYWVRLLTFNFISHYHRVITSVGWGFPKSFSWVFLQKKLKFLSCKKYKMIWNCPSSFQSWSRRIRKCRTCRRGLLKKLSPTPTSTTWRNNEIPGNRKLQEENEINHHWIVLEIQIFTECR